MKEIFFFFFHVIFEREANKLVGGGKKKINGTLGKGGVGQNKIFFSFIRFGLPLTAYSLLIVYSIYYRSLSLTRNAKRPPKHPLKFFFSSPSTTP